MSATGSATQVKRTSLRNAVHRQSTQHAVSAKWNDATSQ
jgi:hypothetical protein